MFRHVNSNLSPLIQQQASGVSQTVVNNVNNEQLDLNQTFFDRSLQRIQHVLGYLGFEYFNNDQPDGQDVVERERAEQLGNQQVMAAGNGFMVAEEGAGDFDVVDRFYMIFRFLFFIGICFAYSSLDKAIIVVFLVLYVYFYNLYRRYVGAFNAAAEAIPNNARNNNRPGSRGTNDNTDESNPTNSESNPVHNNNQPADLTRLSRLTANLRSVISASYHFILAFITSLIPEQPPPVHFD